MMIDVKNNIKKFTQKTKQLISQIDNLNVKERGLILVCTIFLTYLLWRGLVFDHLSSSKQQIASNASKLQRQIFSLQGQISEVSSALNLDPIIRLQEKIAEVFKENNNLEKQLANMTEGLISPKDMTLLLKMLLDKHKNLTLVNLKSIAAIPVFEVNEDNDLISNAKIFQVYKHGIELIITGTFFQLLDFLQEAEGLPWKVLWEDLEYAVVEHPMAKVKIVIKTLSLDSNLFSTS